MMLTTWVGAFSNEGKAEHSFTAEIPLEVEAGTRALHGSATIKAPNVPIRVGEKFDLELRFANQSSEWTFFNPFFERELPVPAALAVYDAEKKYVGNYFAFHRRRQRDAEERHWVLIPRGGFVGTTFELLAGRLPGTNTATPSLLPGKYYLQAIFFNGFIGKDSARRTFVRPEDGNQIAEHFDTHELFRSNVIEIELTDE